MASSNESMNQWIRRSLLLNDGENGDTPAPTTPRYAPTNAGNGTGQQPAAAPMNMNTWIRRSVYGGVGELSINVDSLLR